MNSVFFGNQAYGVEAAAQIYFKKRALDLTLEDSALLVSILPAPSNYQPYRNWSGARERQQRILERLVKVGQLERKDVDRLMAVPLDIVALRHELKAPHFVFRVLNELEGRYPDIRQGGYQVRTSLDPKLQRAAEDTISRRLEKLAAQHVGNAALVALEPESGHVLAYVGSRDYFNDAIQGQVDMANARRQPGSSLKPFVYFQAFLRGFTPATVVADTPVQFESSDGKPYAPRNYGEKFHGPVTMRDSLGSSLNVPAVKVLHELGLGSFVGFLSRFGIVFPEPAEYYGLSLVLGGGEVSLFDVTAAYARLALAAKSVTPVTVLEVSDARGRVLERVQSAPHEPLFPLEPKAEQAAWLVSDILSDRRARALSFGESSLLEVGRPVAVKTGTTKDFRDNWAFGYTPDFVLGVWVGNADNTPMQGVSGITGAVPIWHDVMMERRGSPLVQGGLGGIITRDVCLPSGRLANARCQKSRREWFIEGTEPHEEDDWYSPRKSNTSDLIREPFSLNG